MLFCSSCGGDRRFVAPVAACPHCGAAGVVVDGAHAPPAAAAATPANALPGAPVRIPIVPKASAIVLGAGLIALSVWAVAHWIPSHRPLNIAELAVFCVDGFKAGEDCGSHWMFKGEIYPWAFVVALLVGGSGVARIVSGATYRPLAEVTCKRCRARVVGRKTTRGVECPQGKHLAVRAPTSLVNILVAVAVVLFVVWALALGATSGAATPPPLTPTSVGSPLVAPPSSVDPPRYGALNLREAEIQLNKLTKAMKISIQKQGQWIMGRAPLTPSTPCCASPGGACISTAGTWASSPWLELDVMPRVPFHFQYSYVGTDTEFTFAAIGDADCDGDSIKIVARGRRAKDETLTVTFQRSGND